MRSNYSSDIHHPKIALMHVVDQSKSIQDSWGNCLVVNESVWQSIGFLFHVFMHRCEMSFAVSSHNV